MPQLLTCKPPRHAGNYDIVSAVKHMREGKCKFRVVGLSATPGSEAGKVQAGLGRETLQHESGTLQHVASPSSLACSSTNSRQSWNQPMPACPPLQEVIDNLMICRVEHRAESDPEVLPNVHHKQIELEVRGCGAEFWVRLWEACAKYPGRGEFCGRRGSWAWPCPFRLCHPHMLGAGLVGL